MLIDAGANIAHVSKQMGHASPQTTLTIYTAEFNARENADRTRGMLDGAIGTSLETAAGERWRNGGGVEAATVTEIGSASAMPRAAATGGD